MHEFSLVAGIMDMVDKELRAHGARRLTLARVRYGALSSVMPDAMRMAFEAATAGTPHEGARLELVEESVRVRCTSCGHAFCPPDRQALFLPCPACQESFGLSVEAGEGVFLDHLEAE
ncbi:MAG: hydrogenase maturation nickel metallochaperone HypA [Desulfovibrionaceae bacterium]|nr:hydrogenase maturation nickel metallochaperone HypA [Desulfovibrionaceae bacterium]